MRMRGGNPWTRLTVYLSVQAWKKSECDSAEESAHDDLKGHVFAPVRFPY